MTKYCVFDVETSGLPKWELPAEHPSQPHVASIALIFTDEDFAVESEFLAIVKPDGWEMEPGAMAVNGLTMERLNEEGIAIADAIAPYAAAIDEGRVVIAHNSQFDAKMCRGSLRHVAKAAALASGLLKIDDDQEKVNAVVEPAARFEKTLNICTMRATSELMKIAPTDKMMAAGFKKFKPPKLAEAYEFFFGRPPEGAHTAMGDARACLEIARELKKRGALPPGAVHFAREGTKSGEALKARGGTPIQPKASGEEPAS